MLKKDWLVIDEEHENQGMRSTCIDFSMDEGEEEEIANGPKVDWGHKLKIWKGEKKMDIYNCISELRGNVPNGTLYISSAFLYFVQKDIVKIPLWGICNIIIADSIVALPSPTGNVDVEKYSTCSFLEIQCKNLQTLHFAFKSFSTAQKCYHTLNKFCFGKSQIASFAFDNRQFPPKDFNGWKLFSWEDEFERLGLNPDEWRITTANEEYELCKSYPSKFIVPASVEDADLKTISQFRSSGRMTAFSWRHSNGATITRCSQPLVGIFGSLTRSRADETMLEAVRSLNTNEKILRIVDCRSRISAYANKAKMGGTESLTYYENCSIEFLGIENIHVMRDSMKGLASFALNDEVESNWLQHIACVLTSANRIAVDVEKGSSILIHCSDGWDRTAQISSLVQILLDGHFRTIKGFAKLIEKEWLSFGHKFGDRIGHGDPNFWNAHECSPIFMQFLDCVHQLLKQFPCEFEFSDKYLSEIMDNVYGCSFGTFLFNNERERKDNELYEKTPSLWNYLHDPEVIDKNHFKNHFYNKESDPTKRLSPHRADISNWNYYLRTRGAAIRKEDPEEMKNRKMKIAEEPKDLSYARQVLSQLSACLTIDVDGARRIVINVKDEDGGAQVPIIDEYNPNRSNEQIQTILSHPVVDNQNPSAEWIKVCGDAISSLWSYVSLPTSYLNGISPDGVTDTKVTDTKVTDTSESSSLDD